MTRRSYQMTAGLQHAFGPGLTAYGGIVENLITYQNSADAGLVLGIAAPLLSRASIPRRRIVAAECRPGRCPAMLRWPGLHVVIVQ